VLLLAAMLATLLAGCAQPTPEPTEVAPTDAPPAEESPTQVPAAEEEAPAEQAAPAEEGVAYREAPMLAEMVTAGELPTVEDRLPEEPIVTDLQGEVGQYGGTWRTVWTTNEWIALNNHMRYARLLRLNHDTGFDLFPDIAEDWEQSDDGREVTFHIRKGIKWSDGTPYTTDDVMFWWEDIILNEELTPAVPGVLQSGGEPVTIEQIDEYTFKVTSNEPYGVFPMVFACYPYRDYFVASPKHYLEQFHPNHVDQAELDAMAKEEGFETWDQLFDNKADYYQNPDLPQMTAWVVEIPPDETGRTVWVRNPYYYKVDTAGNQLPYIDRVEWTAIDDREVGVMAAVGGEVDFQIRYYRSSHFTTLKENEAQGDYVAIPFFSYRGTENSTLNFNQTTSDPALQEIFRDVRFRQAMSLAMNREEINQVEFLGLGKPRQTSWPTASPFFDPEWASAYAEHDPDEANRLLDEMGLNERDAEGFRLRPDGKTLEVIYSFPSDDVGPMEELQKEYMEAVGVKVILNPDPNYENNVKSPDLQVGQWMFGGGFLRMREDVLPAGSRGGWGNQWMVWIDTGGESGEEPPAELLRIDELIDLAYSTPDPDKRKEYVQEITDIHKKNLWLIGMVGEAPRIGVIKNNFMNVPTDLPYGGYLPVPAIYAEQYFIEQ
jgi:peptide/nickel transport system substrate-binding protein